MNRRIRKKQKDRRKIQRRIQQHYCAIIAENRALHEKVERLEVGINTIYREYARLKDSIVPVHYDHILEFPYGEDETDETSKRWKYMTEHMFEITGESMWKYLVENKLVTMSREEERFSPEYGSPTAVKFRFVLYVKKPNEAIDSVVNFKMKGGHKDD